MPELIAKPALDVAPVTGAGVTLAPHDPGPITSIALFPGAAAGGLETLGLPFPAPGTWAEKDGALILWTGRDQAFLAGVAPPALEGAALTDQTDGWACFSLAGPGAEALLARLVAIDLCAAAFPPGRVARTGLNHMNLILMRMAAAEFRLFVFRSMARTAWHEMTEALDRLEARAALKA